MMAGDFETDPDSPSRRRFLATAAALGASAAWGGAAAAPSKIRWKEARDLYPEGVASGDPQETSVILWTRKPGASEREVLTLEVSEDERFRRVVAKADAPVEAVSDWTCRVLVGGLKPRKVYWYRFTDAAGNGSRVGRTITAPSATDNKPVRFAFASCQNANQGSMNAYRRMMFEDRAARPEDRLGFVLHLGDFIYEIVWYPEDRPKGYFDRRLREIVRYPTGQKISDFHIPVNLEDYRAVWKGYLHDEDLQDARAWFPFVSMWDNHEFSWRAYQSVQKFGSQVVWAQTRKVAANQAWFEYQPARVVAPEALARFEAPDVKDAPITSWDDQGLGQEPGNLAAIASLTAYRALSFGPNLDLILTDQHNYRAEDPNDRPELDPLGPPLKDFPFIQPEELTHILDAGRTYNDGKPPQTIRIGEAEIPNFRKDSAPVTMLGETQKAWFLGKLGASKAVWKVWGNTNGCLPLRYDPQNLPDTMPLWPGEGYGDGGGGDWSGIITERREIYGFVREKGVTGFAQVMGDRHSFWAGLASADLPPKAFEPVGVAFIGGSISSPGGAEGNEYALKKDAPLRSLILVDVPGQKKPEHNLNLLFRHGVRSALEYAASRDIVKARALSNPDVAPHLSFVDMGGHGYAVVTVDAKAMETEFVCIPRPLERSETEDGGPIRYRVRHRAPIWAKGERPHLEQTVIEGDPKLSI